MLIICQTRHPSGRLAPAWSVRTAATVAPTYGRTGHRTPTAPDDEAISSHLLAPPTKWVFPLALCAVGASGSHGGLQTLGFELLHRAAARRTPRLGFRAAPSYIAGHVCEYWRSAQAARRLHSALPSHRIGSAPHRPRVGARNQTRRLSPDGPVRWRPRAPVHAPRLRVERSLPAHRPRHARPQGDVGPDRWRSGVVRARRCRSARIEPSQSIARNRHGQTCDRYGLSGSCLVTS
jgi:hypothetical protein